MSDTMPIKLTDKDRNDDREFPVKPGTNEETILRYLTIHSEYAFRPMELADETPVAEGSINKTLSRLHDKGLVKKLKTTYHVDHDQLEYIASQLELMHSLDVLSGHSEEEPEDHSTLTESAESETTSDDVTEVFDEMGMELED